MEDALTAFGVGLVEDTHLRVLCGLAVGVGLEEGYVLQRTSHL